MQDNDDRGWGRLRHDWLIAPGLQFGADLSGVSDDGVLRLYEDSLQARAAQRAESNVFLTRTLQNWNFVGRVSVYQDLTTPEPVELQRLPEVSIQGVRQPLPGVPGVLYQIDAGATHFFRELGKNFYSLPIWTERVDNVPEASWLEYSITNRVRGRTVSPEGTEAVRQELLRFTAAHAYDIEGKRWGNLAGDLTIQPTKVLRFRGDVSYNVEHGIFQAGTTDVEATLPLATATVGTRFDRRVPFVPDWVEIPGTYNLGPIPERANVNFLQGGVSSNVWRDLVLRASTNYDARTSTFVESRFRVDLKLQGWSLVVEYINRNPEFAGKTADNEFRFTLNLLGVGGVLSTRLGASESGARLK